MLIKSNEVHPRGIAVRLKDGKVETIRLVPGNNEVAAELWTGARNVPVIAHLLREKKLEESSESIANLAGFSAEHAIELVNGTMNKALLTKWGDKEERAEVLEAISARVDLVTPKKSASKKAPEGDGAGDAKK